MSDTNITPIYKQKVFWAGIVTVIGSIAAYLCSPTPNLGQAITGIFIGIGQILGRQLASDTSVMKFIRKSRKTIT
jgi:hypothetical protein